MRGNSGLKWVCILDEVKSSLDFKNACSCLSVHFQGLSFFRRSYKGARVVVSALAETLRSRLRGPDRTLTFFETGTSPIACTLAGNGCSPVASMR